MMLDEFRRIVETKAPQTLQDRLVTPDEANAVIINYNRMTDPYRAKFMTMPIKNIIEFALTAKSPNGGFKSYVSDVERKKQPSEHEPVAQESVPSQPVLTEQLDYLDEPSAPLEPSKPVAVAKPRKKARMVEETPEPKSQEAFFTRLLEHIDKLAEVKSAITIEPITVQTTEGHVERLVEMEQSMLATLKVMNEQFASQSSDAHSKLTEVLDAHKTMIQQINETQMRMLNAQTQIAAAVTLLAEKVSALALTAPVVNPVVNVPAPVVHVTMEGKRVVTKTVARDENGLITKITEGYGSDE